MRHALEPDHVAAVSTLLAGHAETRPRPISAALLGASWGLGHSLALLVLGGSLLVLDVALPVWTHEVFELAVALLLIVLGVHGIARALATGRQGPHVLHHHGTTQHAHLGALPHLHVGPLAVAQRPLVLGLVHGMAGSGALVALVLARMPTLGSGLVFMALFCLGSVVGMMLFTGAIGLSLERLGQAPRRTLAVATSAGSLVVGVLWLWPRITLMLS
jgi:hypothetical protein